MNKNILIAIGFLGWAMWAYQVVEHQRRLPEVRMWADAAYIAGFNDGSDGVNKGVSRHNQEFSSDAVVDAYNGAWE